MNVVFVLAYSSEKVHYDDTLYYENYEMAIFIPAFDLSRYHFLLKYYNYILHYGAFKMH